LNLQIKCFAIKTIVYANHCSYSFFNTFFRCCVYDFLKFGYICHVIERAGRTPVFLQYKRLLLSIPGLHYFFPFSQTVLYPTSLSKQNRCFYSFFLDYIIIIIIPRRRIFHVRLDWFYVRKGDTILYTILRSPRRTTDISPSNTRIKSTCFLV